MHLIHKVRLIHGFYPKRLRTTMIYDHDPSPTTSPSYSPTSIEVHPIDQCVLSRNIVLYLPHKQLARLIMQCPNSPEITVYIHFLPYLTPLLLIPFLPSLQCTKHQTKLYMYAGSLLRTQHSIQLKACGV